MDSAAHSVNDDDGITGATKVMKLIYYASLYGGERDSGEVRSLHYGLEQPKKQTAVLDHSLVRLLAPLTRLPVRSHRSLHSLRTARFARALRCDHCSLARGKVNYIYKMAILSVFFHFRP